MGGKKVSVDCQMPDMQKVNLEQSGRETLNTVLGVVFESQQKLKSASSNYLEGGDSSGTIPGVQNAVKVLENGTKYLGQDQSLTANELRISTKRIVEATAPIFQKLRQLAEVKTVDGPVDQLNSQVVDLFNQMLFLGVTSESEGMARQIERRLIEKVSEMRQDAGNVGAESVKVEKDLDAERNRFGIWSRGVGYSNDYRDTLSAHRGSLETIRDNARSRGVELQGTCRYVGGNLEGVVGLWTGFVEKNFVKKQ